MLNKVKNLIAAAGTFAAMAILFSFNMPSSNSMKKVSFYKIGHRGTRGLMPENTIQAMNKAIELGCNTIEMDIHLTKDGQVLVYHDDSFNPEYTLMPDGSEIAPADRKKYTFYQMDYACIRKFIIGKKKYPAFPQQQQISCYAPLLTELIDSVENYTKTNKFAQVNYLIEIKSNPQTDGFEQPTPEVLVDKLMTVLKTRKLGSRLIIQSFDVRPLKVLHQKYPKVTLGFLTGDAKVSMKKNLADLGFDPKFYNPHYSMVTAQMVDTCHTHNMLIAPWTVNQLSEMQSVKKLKVDGIITDYPNYFTNLLK
jgi:glycerophosphoryl diester phosphodiesterase